MLFLYSCLLLAAIALLIAGILEQRAHQRRIDSIPRRILINGIRGKSSITRLCAGALRGGGVTTVAKTTGTAARFIEPDGSERPVHRKFGIANVAEQLTVVRQAESHQPTALVVECMAIDPRLQEVSQTKMIQSQIGVICNVREDHLLEMGPTLEDVARSLSRAMPVGGTCVTAEQEHFDILEAEARKRDCLLLRANPHSVTDEEMARFGYVTFKENVSIALSVAGLLGVPRDRALEGMWQAPPDPGVLQVHEYQVLGRQVRFANVMAANDPKSTLMNIQQLLGHNAVQRPLRLVINCRRDRVERNAQMGALVPDIAPERVLLIGQDTHTARHSIPTQWRDLAVDLGGVPAGPELLSAVMAELPNDSNLIAVGNIHGHGEALIEQLTERHEATIASRQRIAGSLAAPQGAAR